MKQLSPLFKFLLSATLLLSSVCFAEGETLEPIPVAPTENPESKAFSKQLVSAGTKFSIQNPLEMTTPRVSTGESDIQVNSSEVSEDGDERISNNATYYYFTSHESAVHTALLVWEYRDKIELQDGSIWSVASGDRWKLYDWSVSDFIIILPNTSFFSLHDYYLVNTRTGDFVSVNLKEIEILPYDPSFRGWRRWIVDIDHIGNFVYLNDGSTWTIPYKDDSSLRYWTPGEVVIVGINDGYNSSAFPNVLINFNHPGWVHGSCLN